MARRQAFFHQFLADDEKKIKQSPLQQAQGQKIRMQHELRPSFRPEMPEKRRYGGNAQKRPKAYKERSRAMVELDAAYLQRQQVADGQ
jgi:hypothetical protein